jgi:hypothetical protein
MEQAELQRTLQEEPTQAGLVESRGGEVEPLPGFEGATEAFSGGTQQPTARVMTEAVVDGIEAVQIEPEDLQTTGSPPHGGFREQPQFAHVCLGAQASRRQPLFVRVGLQVEPGG